VWLPEIIQRGLSCPLQGGLRRIRLGVELQQATLLHDRGEMQEQRLIGHEQLANQHEAE
jgi:hypothetical protein